MTNLHYIADEQLGGVEREYAEVDCEAAPREYVIKDSEVGKALYTSLQSGYEFLHVNLNGYENEHDVWYLEDVNVLEPTGNVRIDGTVYRMVDRKAAVGEKVLADKVREVTYVGTSAMSLDGRIHHNIADLTVLEPIDQAPADTIEQSADLSLTESDVRNNPRQVIDLIANMAGRLSKAESTIESITRDLGWHELGPGRIANTRHKIRELLEEVQRIDERTEDFDERLNAVDDILTDRIDRLGTANQQAYDILARNVETWAQEIETIKARMGDAGRALTAEERREL